MKSNKDVKSLQVNQKKVVRKMVKQERINIMTNDFKLFLIEIQTLIYYNINFLSYIIFINL